MVDLHCVELPHDSPVDELRVNLVLPYGVLDVVVLDVLRPAVVEVVDLASDFSAVLKIESLVNFRVASLAQDA